MQNNGQKVIPFNKFKGVHSGGGGGDMEGRIGRLESNVEYIKRDVAEIKTELKGQRKEIKEFKADMDEFKTDTATEFGKVRTEMATEFGKVRTEMHSIARQTIMWNVGSTFTAVGIVFAILRYLS